MWVHNSILIVGLKADVCVDGFELGERRYSSLFVHIDLLA